MAVSADQAFIVRAIEQEVRTRITTIIAEEITAAKERVATRVQQSVDEIALNILRNYRVFEDRHELHIVVSKELTKP